MNLIVDSLDFIRENYQIPDSLFPSGMPQFDLFGTITGAKSGPDGRYRS